MSSQLSRRGLFRAFRADVTTSPDGDLSTDSMIARIGSACVEPSGVMCRRCGDECDVRAISFRPLGGGKTQARVDAEICTGCGQCLSVCPVQAIDMIPVERLMLVAGLVETGNAP